MKYTGKIEAKAFCPIGKDFYTNNFVFNYQTSRIIDFCLIEKNIREKINKGSILTIEESVNIVYKVLKKLGLRKIGVKSSVDDAVHFMVEVSRGCV